jgi:hypothetical protein
MHRIKKVLIIRPKYGLCNQLKSISKGIIFAMISNRDIFFDKFQLDFRDENNSCDFKDVIDIDYLQKIIFKANINIKIYESFREKESKKWKKIKILTNENISLIKDFIPLLELNENKDEFYLDIDNPISSIIPYEYENLFKYLDLNLKFNDKFISIANTIKTKLHLNNYISIHLRLEDDALNFIRDIDKTVSLDLINDVYKNKYLDAIGEALCLGQNIYICTSLGIDSNKNNDFYSEIKKKYNLIDKNDIMSLDSNSKCDCREIYGIIDFIIAKDSSYFIGCDWSSFSLYLEQFHKKNNTPNKLIDIYNFFDKLKK